MTDQQLSEVWFRRVTKANSLIQKSRFNLTLQQQKIMLFVISQISPADDDFKEYTFRLKDFLQVCGMSTAGKNYNDLKAGLKNIADKSLWVQIGDNDTLLRWIEKVSLNLAAGTVCIRLDRDMKPFLLQLKQNFCSYELFWILRFQSKFAIRLYELINSIHFHELETYEKIYSLDELRQLLDAENYTTYSDFRKRALQPAVDEINKYSDKSLSYEPIKNGRSIVAVKLIIQSKPSLELLKIHSDAEKALGYQGETMFDLLSNAD